ncbi:hypothetical protein [Arhodomonas sp. AD133]|uniref:hypothetical protein n=1 Tax=Arhodomonas sp. AD133 TaxID=3415009 RepID=UPI003EBCB764
MKRFALAAFAASLILAGCATAPQDGGTAPEIAEARQAWLDGDFDRAFPALRDAAATGQPRAQYAVGYMYYYGQGVAEDTDKALAWIRRAAASGDALAVEALGRLAGSVSRNERARRGLSAPLDDKAEAADDAGQ